MRVAYLLLPLLLAATFGYLAWSSDLSVVSIFGGLGAAAMGSLFLKELRVVVRKTPPVPPVPKELNQLEKGSEAHAC